MSYRFEKLVVWQKAMDFCINVYSKTRDFPKDELYGLTSQFRRAATSIPLNISKGSACITKKEFAHFLYIALRSQYEVVTILKLASRLKYLDNSKTMALEEEVAEIGKMLQALINSLEKKPDN